jgi:hypothetical protein
VAKQSVHDAQSACQGEAAIESLRGIVQIIGQAI